MSGKQSNNGINHQINVKGDILLAHKFVKEHDKFILDKLCKARPYQTLYQSLSSWTLMLGTTILMLKGTLLLLPFAVLIFGIKQRALNNVLHDASHRNSFSNKILNDGFANWVVAFPMFENVKDYRWQHSRHHANLGNLDDPDLITTEDNKGGTNTTVLDLFLKNLASYKTLKTSAFSRLFTSSPSTTLKYCLWWSAFSFTHGFLFGLNFLLLFVLCWFSARIFVYHTIVSFTEITDHAGLAKHSIYSFSRTLPEGFMATLIHPFGDIYHLAHHLFPEVPISNLKHLDTILIRLPQYAHAPRYSSYFFGVNPVVKSNKSIVFTPELAQ